MFWERLFRLIHILMYTRFAKLSSLLASRNTLHVSYLVHLIMHCVFIFCIFVWFCLIYFARRLFETSKSALPISWQRCGTGSTAGIGQCPFAEKHNFRKGLWGKRKIPLLLKIGAWFEILGHPLITLIYLQTYVHLFMCLHTISDISDFRNFIRPDNNDVFLLIRVGSRQRRLGEGFLEDIRKKRRGIRDQKPKK